MTVKVICDRNSGKSKGFGFIQFYSESEAMAALHNMNGQVDFSVPEPQVLLVFHYIELCRTCPKCMLL